jgi:ubiquinone/menaquinone biosynthesis C-methylase UbiE
MVAGCQVGAGAQVGRFFRRKEVKVHCVIVLIGCMVLNGITCATSAQGQVGASAPCTHGYHKSFKNAEHWAKIFDDPSRDAWQKRDQVIAAFKLKGNERIADIGAGTGYFAVPLARAVRDGKVFAVDTETDMVKYLRQQARLHKLPNLIAVKAAADDPRVPDKVNLVLVVDTYHHIDSRVEYFNRLQRKLAPDARLAIIDFTESSKLGPPPEHRLAKTKVVQELEAAGYTLAEDLEFLPNQYFIVFRVK